MESFRQAMNIRPGHEWDRFEGLRSDPQQLQAFLGQRRVRGRRRAPPHCTALSRHRKGLAVNIQPEMSTQFGFWRPLLQRARAREKSELVSRIVTTSPERDRFDQSGSMGEPSVACIAPRGPRRYLQEASASPSTFSWEFSAKGQHIELGIAEMNLFILLSALGLSHAINGERPHSDRHAL